MVYLDALTTILSVFAMFLIAYKVIEGWIYWIVADIIYMWIFYSSELYLSTLIYFIFLCSSTIGLIKWTKSTKTA
jgi:nicotinamide mononucleotide transporter